MRTTLLAVAAVLALVGVAVPAGNSATKPKSDGLRPRFTEGGASPVITLTVVLAPGGDGYVYDDGGFVCGTADGDPGPTCTESFSGGTGYVVTLTEVATRGGCSGTDRDCVVTLNSDTTVTANFFYSPPPPSTNCVVPNVKGKRLAAAKRVIKSRHCSVGKITRVTSSRKQRGHVISQRPRPGKRLPKGSKVALKIGK